MHRTRKALVVGAALTVAQAAAAADLALVAGAGDAPEDALRLLGDALNAQGYEVYDRQGATVADLREALSSLAGRLGEADRLILVYAGPVASSGARAWLLPEGLEGVDRIDAALDGVPLDLLLDLAAEVPGRSAVVLGAEPAPDAGAEEDADFLALSSGIEAPELPQGVLLLAGPAGAVLEATQASLLGEAGVGVAEALAVPPQDVEVFGFVSPEPAFLRPIGAQLPPPAERPELAGPQEPEPDADAAAAAEAALGLDQAVRRRIQEQLTVLGYSTRGIDGIFGPGTRTAIEEWQASQALESTGYVTEEQLDLLTALADARAAELAAAAEEARREEEAADAAFWRTTGAGGAPSDLRAYLARYPDGIYSGEARAALGALEEQALAAAAAEDREAWQDARREGSAAAFRRYLDANPGGAFAEQARARIASIEDAPARERASEAAAQAEEALGLNRGSRQLIEGQLAAIGYDVGEADGTFNNRTRRALRSFQARQGLEATGYVNQETVRALIIASLGAR